MLSDDLPVVMLVGPTASGKTGLALALAQERDCEIISMDSAMVYRDMDIGTATPTAEELAAVTHHLINIVDPADNYSAAQFRDDTIRLVDEIRGRGRLPLIVGGTFLYAKAFSEGLSDLPSADTEIREAISAEAEKLGWQALHQRLASIDPVIAERIHPNDAQRIQRALEVHAQTGAMPSQIQGGRAGSYQGAVLKFALQVEDRSLLHERIAERFHLMMEQGFLEEVERLYQRQDLHIDMPAMRCVGYRQLWRYLDGDWGLEEAIYRSIVATRQLAKRQLTWMRGATDSVPLDALKPDVALHSVKELLSNY